MPHRTELTVERKRLTAADRHVLEGYARLQRQKDVVAGLRSGDIRVEQMERLVANTSLTLTEWKRHRELIVKRIAYLETSVHRQPKNPAPR